MEQYQEAVASLEKSAAWSNERFKRWFRSEWLKIHEVTEFVFHLYIGVICLLFDT